jgi:hypothetical protein
LDLGHLNRLSASISVINLPILNVTASYLGREAIRLALEGQATGRLPAMTGIVTSPEPYQMVSCTVHLIKTQPLAALWQAQYSLNTLIGPYTVRPDIDSSQNGIVPYPINNGMIMSIRELNFAGTDEGWVITLSGSYDINASLWQAA